MHVNPLVRRQGYTCRTKYSLTSKDQNEGPNMADIKYMTMTLNWASVTSNLQHVTHIVCKLIHVHMVVGILYAIAITVGTIDGRHTN